MDNNNSNNLDTDKQNSLNYDQESQEVDSAKSFVIEQQWQSNSNIALGKLAIENTYLADNQLRPNQRLSETIPYPHYQNLS